MVFKKQPWNTSDATNYIREIAINNKNIVYKLHAKERMEERGITILDVLYVLKNGFVYTAPEASTREGFFKYQIESKTQNSKNRTVRLVIIPDPDNLVIKIITVMFVDE